MKQALYDAFHGTGQPTTVNGLTFRIDELGWQTNTTAYPQYINPENVAVVSEQTQADYVKEAVQKYFACDPTVTDVEWFLLVDEATRNGKDARDDDRRRLAERPAHGRRPGRLDAEAGLRAGRAALRAGPRRLHGRDGQLDAEELRSLRPDDDHDDARRRASRRRSRRSPRSRRRRSAGSLDTNTCSL